MAHGSKKWIVAYDGKIKRSNDRTKKDYYRNLASWRPYGSRWGNAHKAEFCPQCKHNYKPIKAHNDAVTAEFKAWRAAYNEWLEPHIAEYERYLRRGPYDPTRRDPRYNWELQKKFEAKFGRTALKYIFDEEAWLCPKHRHMHDKQNEMWRGHPHGCNRHYQWMRKAEYNYYRREVTNFMRVEDYDNIPRYKKGWLD